MGRIPTVSDDEIVRRACAVFVERGYCVPTRELASVIGLSWAAVVSRFGNKWALFRRAMAARSLVQPRPTCAKDLTLRELLQQMRQRMARQWPLRLQYRLAVGSAVQDDTEALLDEIAETLEAAAASGEVRSDLTPQALAQVVLALVEGVTSQRFMRGRPVEADLADEVTDARDAALLNAAVSLLHPLAATQFTAPACSSLPRLAPLAATSAVAG